MPDAVPADEVALKKRRDSDAASFISIGSDANSRSKSKKNTKKDKKHKSTQQAEPTIGFVIDVTPSSKKKSKKSKAETATHDADELEAPVEKPKKKRKREVVEEAADDSDEPDEAEITKEKKSKKSKKDKKEKKSKKGKDDSIADQKGDDAEAEQWNVGELDGGAERQDKFLRLLGGKKGKATNGAPKAAKGKSDSTKAEEEIQRQFEAGIKMKNESSGHRRGLGL